MSLEQDLQNQLTAALKAKDLRTANAIRMIKTKVMERRTSKGFQGEVDDALWLEVIAAYKKSLDKAKQVYADAGERGAEDLEQLEWETAFCATFLPKGLGEDEVRQAVRDAIAELGATDPKMAGRIVGAVMKKHKGRVEAAQVKQLATELLSSS